jgi:hypothetical protein
MWRLLRRCAAPCMCACSRHPRERDARPRQSLPGVPSHTWPLIVNGTPVLIVLRQSSVTGNWSRWPHALLKRPFGEPMLSASSRLSDSDWRKPFNDRQRPLTLPLARGSGRGERDRTTWRLRIALPSGKECRPNRRTLLSLQGHLCAIWLGRGGGRVRLPNGQLAHSKSSGQVRAWPGFRAVLIRSSACPRSD